LSALLSPDAGLKGFIYQLQHSRLLVPDSTESCWLSKNVSFQAQRIGKAIDIDLRVHMDDAPLPLILFIISNLSMKRCLYMSESGKVICAFASYGFLITEVYIHFDAAQTSDLTVSDNMLVIKRVACRKI
jgi:hypothetical protein